jgi:hypothetical protein
MKILRYLIFFLLIFGSCKSNKVFTDADDAVKEMSSKRIVRKHLSVDFDKKTLEAKLKVSYDDGKLNESFRVQLKIKKDEVIWMKGTKFITVFRIKITPTTVSYYSPYKKDFFETDFSVLTKLLGVNISFTQLQNMLLGQAVFDMKNNDFTTEIIANSYVLTPKVQVDLFAALFAVNPVNFKLDTQFLRNSEKEQILEISYSNYFEKDKVMIPKNIDILAKERSKSTKISLDYRDVEFNKELDFSHHAPPSYKRIDM